MKDENIEFKDGTMERGLHIDHITILGTLKEIQKDIDIILLKLRQMED